MTSHIVWYLPKGSHSDINPLCVIKEALLRHIVYINIPVVVIYPQKYWKKNTVLKSQISQIWIETLSVGAQAV